MAITDTQKVDYLWKKIGYGRAKTDTGTLKSATNESISSPLLLRGDKIWAQSDLIPAVLPGSTSGVVTVYPTSAPVECDVDITSSTNRTWKTNITDWIPPEIGSTYLVKVYLHTPGSAGSAASSGTQIFGAGSGNNDEWFFDYQSGTLNFIGTNLPSGISGKSVYISGGVYNGLFGVSAPGGASSFTDLFISGISTLSGLLYANSGADIKNIRIGIATDNKIDTTTGNLILDSSSGFTEISDNLYVSGFSTFVGVGTFQSDLYVGGNLGVKGYSEFVGVVTFKGGTINLGDDDTDNIVVSGEFASSLIPTDDATYNLGTSAKRWNDAAFAGIGTFDSGIDANNIRIGADDANKITTSSGNLILDPAGSVIIQDNVIVQNDLTVNGNVTIGGTTVTLLGQDVYIENKDIILGYTTSITPNDNSANHAGVAIASTEGTPLANFDASGINTLPSTYKQMMWFKSGTLGFSTDAFAFNYGVAIGTTNIADGIRLAVGSGITMTDTEISATNFYGNLVGNVTGNVSSADQIKTITASDTNATYHITFVDANNGSATNETVYTDDGIYYNPGTNTFTTQHALFTGNVEVQGTLTATATTSTRATLIDITGTTDNLSYFVPFVDTLAGQNSETLRVGIGLSVNPFTGNVGVSSVLSVGSVNEVNAFIKAGGGSNAMYLYSNGDVSFQSKVITNSIRSSSDINNAISLQNRDVTLENNVIIVGVTTIGTGVGITQFSSSVSTGNSTSSVPTSSAIIDYIDSEIGAVDLTLSLNADSGGPSTVNTSQTLTINGTTSEIETSVSSQTITIGLPDNVIVGGALTATNQLTVGSGVGVTQFSSSVSTGSSTSSVPTSSAIIDYVNSADIGISGDSGTGTVNTTQTLVVNGTANEIETSASNQTITIGLPDAVVVGTSLSAPTMRTGTIQSSNTGETAITIAANDVTIADDLTVGGNLYVNGNTTQVNTTSLTVEDTLVELGLVDAAVPNSDLNKDLGLLFNYYTDSAKKAAVFWDDSAGRIVFADDVTESSSVLTVASNAYASIEIESLWINDCAGQSKVISCTGSERFLENITIDAGSF